MKTIQLFVLMVCVLLAPAEIFAEEHKGAISGTTFNYHVYDGKPYVFSIGYIENRSEYPLEDITVAVQFYNANGELIDAEFDHLYSLVIPPNDKVAFKIQTFATMEKEHYVTQDVRIVDAGHDVPCNKDSGDRGSGSIFSLIKTIIINWFPLLLLVVIWILLAKKYSGKGSNQYRLVELMEKQVEYDEVRNKEIADIASSLKNKRSDNE